jgi:hypothetical protein
MPQEVSRDKSMDRVNAAASKASAKGSGSAGGKLKAVNFTPGKKEMYNRKKS